jgi:alpha-D-ribose 1-methylphosphonate 5-triphosphate synthase subunit PhnI
MGYVAVQGGVTAIENAEKLSNYLRLRSGSEPISVRQIQEQLGYLVDRVISEGSLYSPFHAALALKQVEGDPIEASFYVRAYRSTLKRLPDSLPIDTNVMQLERRISSAFKSIPGGQLLGATPDYKQRIIDFNLAEEDAGKVNSVLHSSSEKLDREGVALDYSEFTKVVDLLRSEGLAPEPEDRGDEPDTDITRDTLLFPCSRGAALQAMARAETGGLLSLAYSSMRGFGDIHPTIAELRVGKVEVKINHPFRKNEEIVIGAIQITEVEIVASKEKKEGEEKPKLTLGYGICFGRNELKAISMAVLDRTLQATEPKAPAEDQEFVILHTDGIEASGFCSHFKLPHYITFQSALERLRENQKLSGDTLTMMKRARDGKGLNNG